jgi:plastocyanin
MSRMRLLVPLVVLALTAMTAVLPSVTSAADDPVVVTVHEGGDMSSWGYTPTTTTIAAGQTVTWTNSGKFAHDIVASDGSWKTGLIKRGESASATFATPGTYAYICSPHPWMQGTIVVTPAVSGAPPAAPAADASAPANAAVQAAPPAAPNAGVSYSANASSSDDAPLSLAADEAPTDTDTGDGA